MSEIPTANTALEQSLFQCAIRERQSRKIFLIALLLPVAAAAVWLIYSSAQLGRWQLTVHGMREAEASRKQAEAGWLARVEAAEEAKQRTQEKLDATRREADASQGRVTALEDTLRKVRGEVDQMEASLTGLTGARWHASLQPKSAPTQTAITENRTLLGQGFAALEEQLEAALPEDKRPARVWICYRDPNAKPLGETLREKLAGLGVAVMAVQERNFGRVEKPRIVFFHDEDRIQAGTLAKSLREVEGLAELQVELDEAAPGLGSRARFEIWLPRP